MGGDSKMSVLKNTSKSRKWKKIIAIFDVFLKSRCGHVWRILFSFKVQPFYGIFDGRVATPWVLEKVLAFGG